MARRSTLSDALCTAGVRDGSARKAAKAVAGFESRCARIEGGSTLLKWMAGFQFAMIAAVLAKLLA